MMGCIERRVGFLAVAVVMATLASCSIDGEQKLDIDNPGTGNYYLPNAIVTVKTLPGGVPYFQLDDSTTLEPVGWRNPYEKEVRALINYKVLGDAGTKFSKRVKVNWINGILTKDALTLFQTEKAGKLGSDPIDLISDWLTVCEDGYLTIHFAAQWSADRVRHAVNLVQTSANPCTFELRHDKNGDMGTLWHEGIVAFRIEGILPRSKGEDFEFWLSWPSFSGVQKIKMKYRYPSYKE